LLIEVEQVRRRWLVRDKNRNNSVIVGCLMEIVQEESVFLDLLPRLSSGHACLGFEDDDRVADEQDDVNTEFFLRDGEFED